MQFKDLERWDITYNQKNAVPFACHTGVIAEISLNTESQIDSKNKDISLVSQAQYDKTESRNDNKPKYPLVALGEILTLQYGKALPKNKRKQGKYTVMGSNGIVGYHNDYLVEAPTIIVGRKGSAGEVNFVEENCYPIDTTFYVINEKNNNMKFLFFMLQNLNLKRELVGIGVPGINRSNVYKIKIPLPPLEIQQEIIDFVESKRAIIKANQSTIQSLQDTMSNELKDLMIAEK